MKGALLSTFAAVMAHFFFLIQVSSRFVLYDLNDAMDSRCARYIIKYRQFHMHCERYG